MAEPLVSVRNLSVAFTNSGKSIHAVNGVDFDLAAGEVLATCATGGALKRDAARGTIGGLLRVPYAAESRWIATPR